MLVTRCQDAIAYANDDSIDSIPLAEEMNVPGMAGIKSRKFLNRVCGFPGCRYLEVGTHRGASLFAAAYNNHGDFTGIDNFSNFTSVSPEAVLRRNRKAFAESCNTIFHLGDCWAVAPNIASDSVDIFFYDGDHSETATGYSLAAFHHAFAQLFVVIFDDWNLGGVRRGATNAIQSGSYRVAYEWEAFTEANGDKEGWWNGIGVFVLEKPATVSP